MRKLGRRVEEAGFDAVMINYPSRKATISGLVQAIWPHVRNALAALRQALAPEDYDPIQHPKRAAARRNFVLGRMVDWLGEAKLSRLGTVLLAFGTAALPFAPSVGWAAHCIAFWPLGTAFTFPAVTAMLSKVIGNEDRGLYMGVQQTFGGASRVIFPIALGWAFDHMVPGAPFWISATLVIVTLSFSFALPASVTDRTPKAT